MSGKTDRRITFLSLTTAALPPDGSGGSWGQYVGRWWCSLVAVGSVSIPKVPHIKPKPSLFSPIVRHLQASHNKPIPDSLFRSKRNPRFSSRISLICPIRLICHSETPHFARNPPFFSPIVRLPQASHNKPIPEAFHAKCETFAFLLVSVLFVPSVLFVIPKPSAHFVILGTWRSLSSSWNSERIRIHRQLASLSWVAWNLIRFFVFLGFFAFSRNLGSLSWVRNLNINICSHIP